MGRSADAEAYDERQIDPQRSFVESGSMSTSRDDIAVLAAGASPAHEAPALTGQLAADADLRKSYRSYLDVAGLLGFDAEATPDQFGDERKERLKARLLAAARASQQSTSAEVDYLRVVPRDLLVPFSEGVSFAVVPGENITTIYWEFDRSMFILAHLSFQRDIHIHDVRFPTLIGDTTAELMRCATQANCQRNEQHAEHDRVRAEQPDPNNEPSDGKEQKCHTQYDRD